MKRLLALLFLALFSTPAAAGVPCSLPFTLTNGTLADANQVMANYNAIIACLGNAAAAGSNNDITALNGLTTPITPGQGGTNVFIGAGASTGSANAQVVAATTPNSFALAVGQRVVFVAGFTNTGAATLNVRATGAINVLRQTAGGLIPLVGSELTAGNIVEAIYDGTQYQLLNTIDGLTGGPGASTALASAATTDLGTVASHNVLITGNTTITSFGSSANVALPVYLIKFTGGLTLTYNSTSLILPGLASVATQTNDAAVALYLGSGNWQVLSYQRSSGSSVVNPTPLPGVVGLVVKNNVSTPNTSIDYQADYVSLINTLFNTPLLVRNVSGTINTTNQNVINGIDGPRGASTWYKVFIISDGVTTGAYMSSVASTTCTGFNTLPPNANYCVYVGSMITDGSTNFRNIRIVGAAANYVVGASGNTTVLPVVTNTTNSAWTGISISPFVPPSATRARLVVAAAVVQSGQIMVAPNGNYGTSAGVTTNPAPCMGQGSVISASASGAFIVCDLTLESTQIFVSTTASTTSVNMYGWFDKVNAN